MKTALVFGGTGQAGSYLVDHLIDVGGYRIVIPTSRSSTLPRYPQPYFVYQIECGVNVQFGTNLVSTPSLAGQCVQSVKPDEVYYFAGKLFAPASWEDPGAQIRISVDAVAEILNAIRKHSLHTKFFFASSADALLCNTPYGIAKRTAQELIRMYRDRYGLFACWANFYNMESSRRDRRFFAEKVAYDVVRLKSAMASGGEGRAAVEREKILHYGDLRPVRDWGWASEYVQAAYQMLQQKDPKDYTIATGESHSCRDFVEAALHCAGFTGPDWFTSFVSCTDKPTDPHHNHTYKDAMYAFWPDLFEAEQDLGFKRQYRFADVVQMLVANEHLAQGFGPEEAKRFARVRESSTTR